MRISIDFEGSADSALAVQDALEDLPDVETVHDERSVDRADNVTGAEVAIGFALVYATPILAAHVVDIIVRIRQMFRPMAVLDLTADEPRLTVIEGAPGHAGALVIKTRDGESATVADRIDVPRAELLEAVQKYLPGS